MSEVTFDLETQNFSYEIGGFHNLEAIGLAVACTYTDGEYKTWWESQAVDLLRYLQEFDFIIGYNVNIFDYRVLSGYSDLAYGLPEKTFDLLAEIKIQSLPLISLDSLAIRNLGKQYRKIYQSSSAVDLWREGRLEELERYCKRDVELTVALRERWEDRGYLWVKDQYYALWPGLRSTQLFGMFTEIV